MFRFWLFLSLTGPLICQERSLIDGIRVLYQEHNYEKAAAIFRQITKTSPGNAEAWRSLGAANVALGRRDEAIAAYQRVIDLHPDSETLVSLALQYDAAGRGPEAIESFERSIRVNPGNVDAYDYLAQTYSRLGRHDDAVRLAKQAIAIRPDDAESYLVLGASYAATAKFAEALEAVQHAIKLRPDDANAYRILASMDQALERYSEAVAALQHAVQLEPSDADSYYQLGVACEAWSLHNGGDPARDQASAALKHAIELQPNFAEAYATLGAQYHRLDHPQEALEACGHAIELKPSYAYARLCLGLASLRLGKTDSAVEQFQSLKILDSELAAQLSNAITKSKTLSGGQLAASDVLWTDSTTGSYSFALKNQLPEAVKNLACQIVFYDQTGNPLQTDNFQYDGVIPPGLAQRVKSKVGSTISALTTKIEIRILDYDIVR